MSGRPTSCAARRRGSVGAASPSCGPWPWRRRRCPPPPPQCPHPSAHTAQRNETAYAAVERSTRGVPGEYERSTRPAVNGAIEGRIVSPHGSGAICKKRDSFHKVSHHVNTYLYVVRIYNVIIFWGTYCTDVLDFRSETNRYLFIFLQIDVITPLTGIYLIHVDLENFI